MSRSLFFCLLLLLHVFLAEAQVVIQKDQLKLSLNDFDEIGKPIHFFKSDGTLLSADHYIMKFDRRDINLAMSFNIIEGGVPDSAIVVKNEQGQTMMRCFVEKGIVRRYEKINPDNNYLIEEAFARNDTVISKYYNKYQQIREEYRAVNGAEVYNWNCSYATETDSLKSCRLRDKVSGRYESYNSKGILVEQTLTKGLAAGIEQQKESFNEQGKLTSKEIKYANGKTKTIANNGKYSITTEVAGGQKVEEYNKAGKLIKSYTAYYPTTISN